MWVSGMDRTYNSFEVLSTEALVAEWLIKGRFLVSQVCYRMGVGGQRRAGGSLAARNVKSNIKFLDVVDVLNKRAADKNLV